MKIALLPVAVVLACAPAAHAAGDPPTLDFDAFGTLGAVYTGEDEADFVRTQSVPRGAGASGEVSARVDSLLGAQLTAVATPRLSAVVQVVALSDHEGEFRPQVEWANVRYQVTEGLALRAGRIALPLFLHSDTRRLGYALPWVRTPLEVYEMVPVTTNDGFDVTWQAAAGAATNTFQLAIGRSLARFATENGAGAGKAETRDQFVASDTLEMGDWALRANYGQARVTIAAFEPLFDGFRQFGPSGAAIADRWAVDGDVLRFMGASVSWDPGPWFAVGEWGRLEADNALGHRQGWYVSGGRRIGDFTPYLTYGKLRPRGPLQLAGIDTAILPASLAAPAGALNAGLNTLLGAAADQTTATAGVRWDAHRSFAVKLQIERVDTGPQSNGLLRNVKPGFRPGSAVNVASLSVDFVL